MSAGTLRRMEKEDLEAVAAVERDCFPDPWSFRLLSDLLTSAYDSVFVLLEEGKLTGYVNVRILGEEAELMRIAVRRASRGKGFGKKLLRFGMREMLARGAVMATLEVRAGNIPAVRLYEAHGFLPEGRRKRYYENPVEDAVLYWNRNLCTWKEEVLNA